MCGGYFDKNLQEGSICIGYRDVLSFILHKYICLHFVYHGTRFYGRYIDSDKGKKYVDDDGIGVKPKKNIRKLYYSKYQETCGNISCFISRYYMNNTRTC